MVADKGNFILIYLQLDMKFTHRFINLHIFSENIHCIIEYFNFNFFQEFILHY